MASAKRDEILDIAENMIRKAGFHGFSFRDVAAATGIKSASVHYHFPSKEDLGQAIAERYTERFIASLPAPESFAGQASGEVVKAMKAAFRTSLMQDGLMCLCGILSAEMTGLPPAVAESTHGFFEAGRAWTNKAFAHTKDGANVDDEERDVAALTLLSRLEGAMLLARAMQDAACFDKVTAKLM